MMAPSALLGCVLLVVVFTITSSRYTPRSTKPWRPMSHGRFHRNYDNKPNVQYFKSQRPSLSPRNYIDDNFVVNFNQIKSVMFDDSAGNEIDDCKHSSRQQIPVKRQRFPRKLSQENPSMAPSSNWDQRIELIPINLEPNYPPKQVYHYQPKEPQVIEINSGGYEPIVLQFRTTSSPLQIKQFHQESERQQIEPTEVEEEPHILKHRIIKPIIQNLHEIIIPKRSIIQEIMPVEEEVRTIVAKASDKTYDHNQQLDNNRESYGQVENNSAATDVLPMVFGNRSDYTVHIDHTFDSSR